MLRILLGIVAGVLAWAAGVVIPNYGLRYGLPGYADVEKAMTFTVTMMTARLGISAVSSLVSGAIAARIGGARAALLTGIVLLATFIPVHYGLWDKFPLWYHLTFLISLPVLAVLGGRIAGR